MASHTNHRQGQEGSTASLVLKAIGHLLDGKPDLLNRVLAVVEAGADCPADESEAPIKMQITPTVQRNFERRGVFPQYRPERAAKILPNLTAVFYVSVEDAEQVLEDVKEQRLKYDGPRGEAVAWTALSRYLERSIKDEKFRGCIKFPGAEKVNEQWNEASAIFKVGDRVAIWHDSGRNGGEATIDGPYRTYLVADDDGPYIDSDGQRVDYCPGYLCVSDHGKRAFFYARQLAPIGQSYGHLKLVK